MEKEIKGEISTLHKWRDLCNLGSELSKMPCSENCKAEETVAAKMVLPLGDHFSVVVWNNCIKTLYAAMRRQCLAVPLPDKTIAQQFQDYFDRQFADEIKPKLDAFVYNPSTWFNHLTRKQQQELTRGKKVTSFAELYALQELTDKPPVYNMFCKREIQIVDESHINYVNSVLPKNRAIAAPQPQDKFVLGPVAWQLESVFCGGVKGWTNAKSWEEQEFLISDYYKRGFHYVAFGDGSSWDRTQSHELKYVDRTIYDYLADNGKIHHVDPEIFRTKATARFRTMNGCVFENGSKKLLWQCKLDATVLSGNADTTLMNTLRMIYVNRFILDQLDIEYELWCKGDDFVIFLKEQIDLLPHYLKFWHSKSAPGEKGYVNAEVRYGLGIVLKYLKVVPIEYFEFCSTNLIQDGDKFKIVRIPTRMDPLSHWSTKALHMSRDEQAYYMLDIAEGIENWGKDMPFFGEYAKMIRELYKPKSPRKPPSKVQAKTILADGERQLDCDAKDAEKGFDYYHSQRLRKSNTTVSEDAVYTFLFRHYGLTKADIDSHFISMKMQFGELLSATPGWYDDC